MAALTDNEIRDAQMQDSDTCSMSKWKTEVYTPTELDISLSIKAVKHFWNCSSQLQVLNIVLFYEWLEGPVPKLLLVVPKSNQICVLEGSHDNKLARHIA